MHAFRIWFVHNNEAKTRIDLGVVLEKNKVEGIGWTRAFQLVATDVNGFFPRGNIEFEKAGPIFP